MGKLFVWEDVRYSQFVMLNVVKHLFADTIEHAKFVIRSFAMLRMTRRLASAES